MIPTVHNASTYGNHGCRCVECRTAHARRCAEYRAARRARLDQLVEHGASAYSNWGCRCEVCTDGNTVYKRAMRNRDSAR